MGISALKVLWTKRQHYSQNENLCEEVVEYKVIVYDSATAACKWANLTENNNNSYIVNWQHSMNLIRYFQNSAVFIHAPILQSRCYVWFSLEWIINWPANQLFSSQCTGECVRKECAIIECTGWKLCCWSWLKSLKRVEHTKIHAEYLKGNYLIQKIQTQIFCISPWSSSWTAFKMQLQRELVVLLEF